MDIIGNTAGIEALKANLEAAQTELPGLLEQAAQEAGNLMQQALSDGAPRGHSEGPPPDGDAPGTLADSFTVQPGEQSGGEVVSVEVVTSQPTKLRYVTQGTGLFGPFGQRIIPTSKQALAWPGGEHPVRSVAGMHPNDFVTPVLDSGIPDAGEVLQVVVDELAAILEGG